MLEYKEYESTVTHDGEEYDLNTMFAMAQQLPVAYFKVDDLKWILKDAEVDNVRKEVADTTVPLLIAVYQDQWVIIDGLHRLARAVEKGMSMLPGKVVDTSILVICKK